MDTQHKKREHPRRWPVVVIALVVAMALAFVAYVSVYYHADGTALAALEDTATVDVEQTGFGWLFDGPSDDTALVFYPGGKVEASAYAPLLHLLAKDGVDVCLVKMPFNLAVFDADAAQRVMEEQDYETWYVGGHSLGGAMAAGFAARNASSVAGVVLCAAYPTEQLERGLLEVSLYGSEDKVLNREEFEKGRSRAPARLVEKVIAGGNHAQFGSYGAQDGDGQATISAEQQWEEATRTIVSSLT